MTTRASVTMGLALAVVVLLLMLLTVAAGAAEPSPSPGAAVLLEGGDLRSEGEGPGISGSPLLVLAAVVALGLGTALGTVVLSRVSRRA